MATAHETGKSESGADNWFSPGRFAALLGLLIAATFFPVVAGLRTFVFTDSGLFADPVAYYHRESFWRGELPLWNPLSSCGMPFLAQWNTMTLYPGSLIYLLLPFPWSFGMFRLVHLLLGGGGMYSLAVRWTGNRFAGVVAGVAFAFNGLTWYGLMWPHLIAALGWMPWLVLATEQAWSRGGRAVIIAALVGAMQMLSGGVEVIIQTWLLIATLWLVQMFRGGIPRVKLPLRAASIVCLVAGLAAAQLFPFLELLGHSQRQSGFGSSTMAAMPLMGWANYLVPLFDSAPAPAGGYVQEGQNWTSSYYLGIGTLALAALAAWRIPDRKVRFLAGVALFGLLMSFGGHAFLYNWVEHVFPWLALMRFPVKFVVLTTFCLPLMSASELSWLLNLSAQVRPKEWRNVAILGGGFICSIAFIIWFSSQHPVAGVASGVVLSNAALRAVFLALILGCLAIIPWQTSPGRQLFFRVVFIVLLWLDVYTHAPDLNPTASISTLKPDTVREFFQWTNAPAAGGSRAMQGKEAFWKLLASGYPDQDTDIVGRRLSLFMDLNLLDRIPKVDGFYSIDLNDYLDVFKRLYFTTNEAAGLKDFLAVSQITSPTNPVAWVARDSFLPLITAGQKPIFADKTNTLTAIFANDFNPRETVYLPLDARSEIQATGSAHVQVLSQQFSAQRLQIEIQTDASAMVVVAQSFYYPWHAYTDGKPTALWRANHAFQAIEVPAGKHTIILAYEDSAFFWGSILSLVSLAVAVAALIAYRQMPAQIKPPTDFAKAG